MQTGCLANKKGGVGKTTNTLHLGARLAQLKKRVLLIDFDPQCDLTHGAGINEYDYDIMDFITDSSALSPIQKSDNLYVLPGNDQLIASKLNKNALKAALKPYSEHFDYVLIDTPPASINDEELTNSEIALAASDFFLIAMEPKAYSVKNANSFLGSVNNKIAKYNTDLKFVGFLFSNVLVTKKNIRVWSNFMNEKTEDLLFKSFIRTDSQVEEAVDQGLTIFQYNPNCRASLDYVSFTREFLKKVEPILK